MARKDKVITPSVTQKLQALGYNVADWDDSQTSSKLNRDITEVLNLASKKQNGNIGYPDRIYCNSEKKLLILVEEKSNTKEHDAPKIDKGAVAGVKWYLSCFLKNIEKFERWNILGIAVSGDLLTDYNHKFSCFHIDKSNGITQLSNVTNFLNEDQFIALFNNLNEEDAIAKVSKVSKKINNLLRSIDSQKRPVLLSALMISLYSASDVENSFPSLFKSYDGMQILHNLYYTVENVLQKKGLPPEKLTALKGEIESLKTDKNLQETDILKDILIELDGTILPLFESHFSTSSNYDIMGRFYEEFLKYAGVSNVKKGIVLTPRHIATLFTKLVPIRSNDILLDLCCGTGAFLIAGMNELISIIDNSGRTDKINAISDVKEKQLIGFEINTTMYICAISNMLFRGDGKSSIYNLSSIGNPQADQILIQKRPTIGFINPPYSGRESKTDPTPKEITFLQKMLDNCSRYGIMIAPLSVYFKDNDVRNAILKKHTLKYVINMPNDLFQPNAMTHTAISVFETNTPQGNKKVMFYDMRDDGFSLSKKGRTDIYNDWNKVQKDLLDYLSGEIKKDDITTTEAAIKNNDEWTAYAHLKTDYSTLDYKDFVRAVSDYLIFNTKNDLKLLNSSISEFEMLEILASYYAQFNIGNTKTSDNDDKNLEKVLFSREFKLFKFEEVFKYERGKRYKSEDHEVGDVAYISSTSTNNGIDNFVSPPDYMKKYNNRITLANSGSVGSFFYHSYCFVASDHVMIIDTKKQELNENIALFLKPVFEKMKYKYSFGREINDKRLSSELILLPIDEKSRPDWSFMNSYVSSLKDYIIKKIIKW